MIRTHRHRGAALIEVLVALFTIVIVFLIVCRVILGGAVVSQATADRSASLKSVEAELECIAGTPYDDLPPEIHQVQVRIGADRVPVCRVQLRNRPLPGSVKIWHDRGKLSESDYSVDYRTGQVVLPTTLNGRIVNISYRYEYLRRALRVIPKDKPYRIRLDSYPLNEGVGVVDTQGGAVTCEVQADEGFLDFGPRDAGKTVQIRYRGQDDKGVVQGRFLSSDLKKDSVTDEGVKLLTVTESWGGDAKPKRIELRYIRTR